MLICFYKNYRYTFTLFTLFVVVGVLFISQKTHAMITSGSSLVEDPSHDMNHTDYELIKSADSRFIYLAAARGRSQRSQRKSAQKKSISSKAGSRSAARSQKKAKNRSAILRSEKSYKIGRGEKSTVIDFDETDITGERRDPGVGFVQSTLSERKSNFVKIRREWHYAMTQSTQLVD